MSRLITRKLFLGTAVAGLAFVPAAAAQAAPTTLAAEQAPTRVAAWESTVMWSRQDPATGSYGLMKSVDGGAPTPVAVPKRAGRPFDIDLGTSSSGSTFGVYTRGGDIYRLNVATGVEAKVLRLSSPNVESSPTIQHGRIAFIRRNGRFDELHVGTVKTGSHVLLRGASILSAELGERHVAYVTSGFGAMLGESQMHIRNLATGSDKMVYRARSGGSNHASIFRASYIARPEGFLWARTNVGSGSGSRLVRYTLNGGKLDYAAGDMSFISTAWANETLGAVTTSVSGGSESADSTKPGACTDGNVRRCDIVLTGPLSFGLTP